MRPSVYPTHVNLKDLAEGGETFRFSRATGELNKTLKDLVAGRDYEVELHLKAMGNAFEISGEISTSLDLVCAHCGREVIEPLKDRFNELIVVMSEKPRAGHSGHTGQSLDDGPFCNYLTSYNLNLAEFVHEHIAAAEPYAVRCGKPDCEARFESTVPADETKKPEKNSPFSVLKELNWKLNSKKGQRG